MLNVPAHVLASLALLRQMSPCNLSGAISERLVTPDYPLKLQPSTFLCLSLNPKQIPIAARQVAGLKWLRSGPSASPASATIVRIYDVV